MCYCCQVAAPRPLPGGSQVQVFDLAGFKLSMVNSELITLMKVRAALWVAGVVAIHLAHVYGMLNGCLLADASSALHLTAYIACCSRTPCNQCLLCI
jgi:hypothetical protein